MKHLRHPHNTKMPKWVTCAVVGNSTYEGVYTAAHEHMGILSTKRIPGFTCYRPVGVASGDLPPIYFFPQRGRIRDRTVEGVTVSDAGNITTTAGIAPQYGGTLFKLWVSGAGISALPNPTQILNHCSAPGRAMGGAIFFKNSAGDLLNPNHNGGTNGQLVDFGTGSIGPYSVTHCTPMTHFQVLRGQPDCGAFIETKAIACEWDPTGLSAGAFDFDVATDNLGRGTTMVLYPEIVYTQRLWLDWQGRTGLIKVEYIHEFPHNIEINDQFASNEMPITHFRFGFDKVYFYDVSSGVGPDLMTGVESTNSGIEYDQLGGNHNLTVRTDLTTITQDGTTYTEASLASGASVGMIWLADGTNAGYSLGDAGSGLEFAVGVYHSNMQKPTVANSQWGSFAMIQAGRTETGSPSNDENATDTAIIDHAYGWNGTPPHDYIPGGRSSYVSYLSVGELTKVTGDMDWLEANGY